MNSKPHNPPASESAPAAEPTAVDATLRLIASLPAPAGLEDRVRKALQAAPGSGSERQVFAAGATNRGRVLAWPKVLRPESNWMRAAAAAAIVFVVAGGGWGVYTRVERNQPAKVIVMPPRLPVSGGFTSAGAVRTPQTLPGPTLTKPATHRAQRKGAKKPATSPKPASAATPHSAAEAGPPIQPAPSK